MPYTRAIVRPPGPNFAEGLTSSAEGRPDHALALEQHRRYCQALEECGLEITELAVDPQFPDGCFVEDTAIVTGEGAIALRSAASSRVGELESVLAELRNHYREVAQIFSPGTVDGGDVCEVENHFLIGVSSRTNEQGARQLVRLLTELNFTASVVDIRGTRALLHLKSGLSYLGNNRVVVTETIAKAAPFAQYERIVVGVDERYSANCIRVNDFVLVAAGYPQLIAELEAARYHIVPLEMSEFRKMDGGLSCLSLRF